jgi:hypothetical protein
MPAAHAGVPVLVPSSRLSLRTQISILKSVLFIAVLAPVLYHTNVPADPRAWDCHGAARQFAECHPDLVLSRYAQGLIFAAGCAARFRALSCHCVLSRSEPFQHDKLFKCESFHGVHPSKGPAPDQGMSCVPSCPAPM